MRFGFSKNNQHADARAAEASNDVCCPFCGAKLVLRRGARRAPHYAHRPHAACKRGPGPVRSGAGQASKLFDTPASKTEHRGTSRRGVGSYNEAQLMLDWSDAQSATGVSADNAEPSAVLTERSFGVFAGLVRRWRDRRRRK